MIPVGDREGLNQLSEGVVQVALETLLLVDIVLIYVVHCVRIKAIDSFEQRHLVRNKTSLFVAVLSYEESQGASGLLGSQIYSIWTRTDEGRVFLVRLGAVILLPSL